MLFSQTLQRVLVLFFCFPDRSYHTTQLIYLVNAGSGAVQRVLAQLLASELVIASEVGKRRLFRANRASPIFPDLHSLLMKTSGVSDPIRDALAPVAARIRFATIYGSIAKGTETAESDVDLLIVSDDLSLEELFELLQPAEQQLRRKVSPTLYEAKEFERRRRERNAFVTKVLDGERIDLLGSPDATSQAR